MYERILDSSAWSMRASTILASMTRRRLHANPESSSLGVIGGTIVLPMVSNMIGMTATMILREVDGVLQQVSSVSASLLQSPPGGAPDSEVSSTSHVTGHRFDYGDIHRSKRMQRFAVANISQVLSLLRFSLSHRVLR